MSQHAIDIIASLIVFTGEIVDTTTTAGMAGRLKVRMLSALESEIGIAWPIVESDTWYAMCAAVLSGEAPNMLRAFADTLGHLVPAWHSLDCPKTAEEWLDRYYEEAD